MRKRLCSADYTKYQSISCTCGVSLSLPAAAKARLTWSGISKGWVLVLWVRASHQTTSIHPMRTAALPWFVQSLFAFWGVCYGDFIASFSCVWPGPASEAAIRIRVPYSTSLVWSVSNRGWVVLVRVLGWFLFCTCFSCSLSACYIQRCSTNRYDYTHGAIWIMQLLTK